MREGLGGGEGRGGVSGKGRAVHAHLHPPTPPPHTPDTPNTPTLPPPHPPDLLNMEGRDLKVRDNPDIGAYIDGVKWCVLSTHGDIDTILDEGNRNRTVAATKMNAESSRR